MIVHEGRFKSFVDVEMSRYANAVFLVGTGLFVVWRQSYSHMKSLISGYLHASGRQETKEFLTWCHILAPFSYWVSFSWYFNMDKLTPWAIATNHRHKILLLLISTVRHSQCAGI
jgi:hypothetical protein